MWRDDAWACARLLIGWSAAQHMSLRCNCCLIPLACSCSHWSSVEGNNGKQWRHAGFKGCLPLLISTTDHLAVNSVHRHRTGTLRCLQKEMATYRHWSVSLWRDPDDVSHCRILSPRKLNGGLSLLRFADEDTVTWLTNYGSWHAYEKKKTGLWHFRFAA